MGKREQFKLQRREAKALGKRRKNVRSKIVRFLIVCEGTETEPNYFRAFIDNHYSEVLEKFHMLACDMGKGEKGRD